MSASLAISFPWELVLLEVPMTKSSMSSQKGEVHCTASHVAIPNAKIRVFTESALLNAPRAYRTGAKSFVGFLEREGYELGWTGFEAYVEHLEDRYDSARTFNYYLSSAKNRLRYLLYNAPDLDVGTRFQVEQALEKVKGRKVAKEDQKISPSDCLTGEEVRDFLIGCDKPKVRLWVEFLWVTGCRVSEMLNIRLSRIKQKDHLVEIKVLSKGGKERTVKINRDLLKRIRADFKGKRYLFESPHKQDYQLSLFEKKKIRWRRYTREYVSQYITREAKRILGKHVSAHTLRHSFATEKIRKTRKVQSVSEYLGHSSCAITLDMYCHEELTEEDLELF
jgi:integrase/recombinase XerD